MKVQLTVGEVTQRGTTYYSHCPLHHVKGCSLWTETCIWRFPSSRFI